MGKYKVPHFDAKGESDAYFTEQDVKKKKEESEELVKLSSGCCTNEVVGNRFHFHILINELTGLF
jgi:hypothetical protein